MAEENLELALAVRADIQDAVRELRQLRGEVGGVGETSQQAAGGVGGLNNNLSRTGEHLRTIRTLAASAAAGLAAIGAGRAIQRAVDEYASLEQGLVEVQKVSTLTSDEIQSLKGDVQEMATEVPVATDELLDIAGAAGRLGVDGKDNILGFTEVVAQMGRATDLQGEEAATTLARILNITGEGPERVKPLASAFVELGNNAAASESEIANAANEVARATADFEVSSEEAAGLGAAMAEMGVRAETGGTAVGRTMRTIADVVREGGEELEQLTQLTGQSAEDIQKQLDENPMELFQQVLQGIRDDGRDASVVLEEFGLQGEEVAKTIGPLVQNADDLAEHLGRANQGAEEGTALQEEFEQAIGTLRGELDLLQSTLGVVYEQVGEEMAPAVRDFSEGLRDLAGEDEQIEAIAASLGGVLTVTQKIAEWTGTVVEGYGRLGNYIGRELLPMLMEIEQGDGGTPARLQLQQKLNDMLAEREELQRKIRVNEETAQEESGAVAGQAAANAKQYRSELERLDGDIERLRGNVDRYDEGTRAANEATKEGADASREDADAKDEEAERIHAAGASAEEFESALDSATEAALRDAEEQATAWEQVAEEIKDQVDPLRSIKREMAQVRAAMERGDISTDFGMARLMQLQEEMGEVGEAAGDMEEDAEDAFGGMSQYAVQARRNIESELADTLAQSMKGKYDEILDGWVAMIRQMVSEAAAADLMESLTGEGQEGEGWIGEAWDWASGWFSGGEAHTGGIAGPGLTDRPMHAAMLAGAPRYKTGGIAGLKPDEVPAVLHKGEEVLTREDPRHRANGGGQSINVNVRTPEGQTDEQARRSGSQQGKAIAREISRAQKRNL
ncbi:MAG: phage tail tape measure protein [Thiohalorhabdus sp.]|uniref:phage tail tape measure protein n=1 Tax=Thiohalorhabdus sp. TaxID=3094134 RepID=UPI00397FE665